MTITALLDFLSDDQPSIAVKTPPDLYELNEKGLPGYVLTQVIEVFALNTKMTAELLQISPRTIERAKRADDLSKQMSDKLIRLIDVYQKGLEVFDTREDFLKWLHTPKTYFDHKKPIELLSNATGIELVLDELGRIEHGILS